MPGKYAAEPVTTYQFDVDDELWESWKDTVPRSKSLDTRLRELIKADRDGRVLPPDHAVDDATDAYDVVDEAITERDVVNRVSASWDDDDRLEDRRAAAAAAVKLLEERGELSRSETVDELLPGYAVDGQNEESWYRQNIRPVLREVATYSAGRQTYVLDEAE